MRRAICFGLVLFCTPTFAANVDWPSSSCNSTLQACLNAAAPGDQIEIRTQAIIAEDLTINKSVTLRSDGTAARFGPDRTITITAVNNGDNITLENLWLSGPVTGTFGSTNAAHNQSVTLTQMHIDVPASAGASVNFTRVTGTTSNATVTVSRSTLVARSTSNAALRVLSPTSGGSTLANLFDNQITSVFDGISVSIGAGRTNILANRVGRGARALTTEVAVYAISVEGRGSLTATPIVQIARNVTSNFSSGLVVNAVSAPLDTRVLNNTFARNALTAIDLLRTGATLPTHVGRVANNLVAGASCGLGYRNTAVGITADYNFYQADSATCLGASLGANDRVGVPQFIAHNNFRTRATSPNIDAGNNADQPAFLGPSPDFDGRNGRVNGTVDMGAHEFSIDVSFEHQSTIANIASNITTLTQPPLTLVNTDVLQIGQFGRDIDFGSLIPNQAVHLGVWFKPTDQRFSIFNQNSFGVMAPNRRFFVLLNQDSNTNLRHVASGSNTLFNVTTLDHPQLNGQASAIPIVTQQWDPDGDGDGTYNNSAIGVWYDTTPPARWKIFNQSGTSGAPNISAGAAFNVMIPNLFALGSQAFRTPTLAVPVTILNLDHPLLNNTECAHPYVTAVYNPNNVYVPANLVMSYNPSTDGRGNWAIERGDGLQIPAGAAFHVFVDPQQSRQCRNDVIFSDGFEAYP
jgi:hypothetical protein